jgi:predicted nucleic acid-binding protein
VILVETDVLFRVYHPQSAFHEGCRSWVDAEFSGEEPVCLARVTLLAFIRISTNPRVSAQPVLC